MANAIFGDCTEWLFETPFTHKMKEPHNYCTIAVISKLIGISVLIVGSCLKLPQARTALTSTDGVAMTPILIEAIALSITNNFYVRNTSPLSTYGEGIAVLAADIFILIAHVARHSQIRVSILYVILSAIWIRLMVVVGDEYLGWMFISTFPMFIGSASLQIWINFKQKHIGRLSPLMLYCCLYCALGRVLTTLIEIEDAFARFQSVVGLVPATVLVLQCIMYRRNTSLFLLKSSISTIKKKKNHRKHK